MVVEVGGAAAAAGAVAVVATVAEIAATAETAGKKDLIALTGTLHSVERRIYPF
jgi:hypothetical protein